MINIDLQDFFDSFHFGRVVGFFEKNKNYKCTNEVAILIAQLTCHNGKLPQGAPTSPLITNIICQIMDMRILRIAKKYHLDYTRYADDLSFSTNDKKFLEKWEAFYKEITDEIVRAGLKVNADKTRMQYRDSRQSVTGLTVNKKINIDRRFYKQVRAMANSLYVNNTFVNGTKDGTIKQLEGKFSFIDQIDKYNNIKDRETHSIYNLNGREKQYQKFLFFKYFIALDKPLIITEGKTDVKYIKSALKKLYKDYPELIERNPDGTFNFKISFLRRTKRLKYFFNMSQDGADTMKNIYNFYSSKNNKFHNYFAEFKNIGRIPAHPVIMIFDNELANKSNPLSCFASYISLGDKEKDRLKKDLFLNIVEDSNLFLLTHQLIQGKKECEIEDLFDETTLNHKIGEKTFSRNDKADKSFFYGKEIFANYIQSNYININFDEFKPFLDNIVKIMDEYNKCIKTDTDQGNTMK